MKKLFLIALCLISVQMTVKAADDNTMLIITKADGKPVQKTDLPIASQEFLDKYYCDIKISKATVENDTTMMMENDITMMRETTYEVALEDGTVIEFDKNGDWKDIKSKKPNSYIPTTIVPDEIIDYIGENYEGEHKITEIQRDAHQYKVRLDNGDDMKFNIASRRR